ncbi:MAG: EF-hand domain-containing protein [Bryobacteraceae bacterium]|nr:EF-hand domain-containing protein [Bryobacteraceae bacterium]
MRKRYLSLALVIGGSLWAQPGGGRGPGRPSPLVTALDADRDGTVSASEIAAAAAALRTLDKNGDGVVAIEEVMPPRPPQEQSGAIAPELVETLFSFDENKDGKLAKTEVPERMQGIFARADANHDGFLTRDELTKVTVAQDRRAGGPPQDLVFRALDLDHDNVLSAVEIDAAPKSLRSLDKDGDGALQAQEMRPMRGPGGNPEEMIKHLFEENDANHDGQLSKTEMPERMREMFGRLDENKDGLVSKEELTKGMRRP